MCGQPGQSTAKWQTHRVSPTVNHLQHLQRESSQPPEVEPKWQKGQKDPFPRLLSRASPAPSRARARQWSPKWSETGAKCPVQKL